MLFTAHFHCGRGWRCHVITIYHCIFSCLLSDSRNFRLCSGLGVYDTKINLDVCCYVTCKMQTCTCPLQNESGLWLCNLCVIYVKSTHVKQKRKVCTFLCLQYWKYWDILRSVCYVCGPYIVSLVTISAGPVNDQIWKRVGKEDVISQYSQAWLASSI